MLHMYPGKAEVLTHLVGNGLSNEEILELLQSEQKLQSAAEIMQSFHQDGSTSLEEAVFMQVSQLDSELCAQVTGMLLELPPLRLARLLQDGARLGEAVRAARAEYLRFTGGAAGTVTTSAATPAPEELGDQLFTALSAQHPELAPQLTGMLLELPTDQLHQLLADPKLLQLRTSQALEAIGR
ncbi:uncharacterized protein LOC119103368 isoform X3 [Pollicipes pollicipes]|uniref:uncharacterized protein LOC119103368 isoform X3 n=1 Tax=Pollicipes pollicipes TaxID=41117 RepID=UPI0018849209|nr:uncharacterized protein LOC119103368 isoform X3 [Pollicipes pollicipes]